MLSSSLLAPVAELLREVVPDSDRRAELAQELATMGERHAQELALAQIQANATAAATGGWYRAGWRPATGWVCVAAMGWQYVAAPLASAVTGVAMPSLDAGELMPLLLGLLGLGGLRSAEKIKGVS